jgi:HPt (histidine-containing phosphotransfer) domain-containing protein
MDDYISKPVQVEELVEALSKCRPHRPEIRSILAEKSAAPAQQAPAPAGLSPETPSREVLDPAALERLRATLGKQADQMLPDLIEKFYGDADRLLDQARQALEQEHVDDLRRAAHSLKSTSATFGAMKLSAVAQKLEHLARDGRLDGTAQLIVRAEAEFSRARAALETLQDEP